MTSWRLVAMVAIVGFLAALAGVFAGRLLLPSRAEAPPDLHQILHGMLGLDAAQKAQVIVLEQGFDRDRRRLEARMRADNARLAEAIEAEHGNGPRVQAAVDSSHHAMGELQKTTIAHVFAVRRLLRPDQAAHLDVMVSRTLTAEPR